MPQGAGRVVGITGLIVVGALVVAIAFASAMHIGDAEARHFEIIAGRSVLTLFGPGMWLALFSGISMACAPLYLKEGRDRMRTQA